MKITEDVERYDDLLKWDKENNDIQRVLLSAEAQSDAVVEAEENGVFAGYSELWEHGFSIKGEEDEEKKRNIEAEMDSIYVRIFSEKISEFFVEVAYR